MNFRFKRKEVLDYVSDCQIFESICGVLSSLLSHISHVALLNCGSFLTSISISGKLSERGILSVNPQIETFSELYIYIYRVSREECARLREVVP